METQGYWSSDCRVWDCSADPTTPQEHWLPLWSHQGAECSLQPKHKDRGRAPLSCHCLSCLLPRRAMPCCWCCFHAGGERRAGGERVCRAAVSAVCALCADKLPSPDVPRVSRRLLPSRLSPSSESTVLCAGGGQPFPATLPQGLLWPLGARDLHLKVWTLSCPSRHRVFTWVFVHPPEQSPPWRRQLGDGMASPDTAQCLYKSFVTRCSPPG